MKFGSARGSVRKIIARDMPGLKRDAVKVVDLADSKTSAGVSDYVCRTDARKIIVAVSIARRPYTSSNQVGNTRIRYGAGRRDGEPGGANPRCWPPGSPGGGPILKIAPGKGRGVVGGGGGFRARARGRGGVPPPLHYRVAPRRFAEPR